MSADTTTTTSTSKGLEGVVIAQTQKSKVQGDIGKLQYHGYNIIDLAENASYEEVVYLLWYEKLPTRSELEAFNVRRADGRVPPAENSDMCELLIQYTVPYA